MPDYRPLTAGEASLARSIFGGAIDYERVRIANRKWAFFQPRNVTMAPTGTIHFHPRGDRYRMDFAQAGPALQGLFVHEMTHIWQTQARGRFYLPLMRHPFCRYDYTLVPGRPFDGYGLEQQAEIVRHAFLLRGGVAVPDAPDAAALEELLPFRT
ncbi:vgr related protein [Stakelama saccharophila]|uniref:Vgr related protein n=1 Tax=Stakelama saccharophila TaxID=3075605 RepID=A0ABZ0BBH5_9SPHN|nr:vgr related protein [Stakelama sp. W311]WNO54642.1 vgr related protein [Stakelama sp. W311]